MERLSYDYPAGKPAGGRVFTGVVASGDLEVLLEPNVAGATTISVSTSIDGYGRVWEALLTRVFSAHLLPAARIEINDFGATPGVVRMRVEQAFEELNQANGE